MSKREIITKVSLSGSESRPAYNPSEELGGTTNSNEWHRKDLQLESPEIAEASAYAAKPFMDTAVDIYDGLMIGYERTYGKEYSQSDETKIEIMGFPGLGELVAIGASHAAEAEKNAMTSGSHGEIKISDLEQVFLDAMQAVAGYQKLLAGIDMDSFESDKNPNVITEIVSTVPDLSSGKRITLMQKLESLKYDPIKYNEDQHLSDTSDYVLREIGQKVISGDSLEQGDKMHLKSRLGALQRDSEILLLLKTKYNFDKTTDD